MYFCVSVNWDVSRCVQKCMPLRILHNFKIFTHLKPGSKYKSILNIFVTQECSRKIRSISYTMVADALAPWVVRRQKIRYSLRWMNGFLPYLRNAFNYRQLCNVRRTKSLNLNVCVSSFRCLRPIHWSQVLSREWRCSWSSDAPTIHLSDQHVYCLLRCVFWFDGTCPCIIMLRMLENAYVYFMFSKTNSVRQLRLIKDMLSLNCMCIICLWTNIFWKSRWNATT